MEKASPSSLRSLPSNCASRAVRRACGRLQLGSDFLIGFRLESRFPDQCSSGVSRGETSGVPPLNFQRDAACCGPQWTLDARAGIKIPSEFKSLGLVVESTARNCGKRLRRRVADSKYGFECCCGQQRALKWQGWRPAVKGTSRGLGKTQRSSAPVLLPYHPETSSKERYAGPPLRNQ